MEHLSRPTGAEDWIRCRYIPNTFGQLTEQSSFADHEKEAGPRLLALLRKHLDKKVTDDALEGFFQSWLFFSLLREVLSPRIRNEEFLSSNHDIIYLDTASLDHWISRWREHYTNANVAARQQTRMKTASRLRHATFILSWLAGAFEMRMINSRFVSQELEVVLRCLVQTLEFRLLPDDLPRQRVVQDDIHICHWLSQRLLMQHWCPNQVAMLGHTLDVPSLYYATLLGYDASGRSHAPCSPSLCRANQIDQSTYRTIHTQSACHCDYLGPSSAVLTSLIEAERIPVIDVHHNSSGALSVGVSNQDEQVPYVAISHVWADGLGNPTDNQLPTCQLQRLLQLVRSILPGRPLFWCDTLCVPVRPAELRRKAIWKMRDIYEKAYTVLIIDASLKEVRHDVPPEELLMRITCSSWVRRLWTFQERILARRLSVVLRKNTIADVDLAHKSVHTFLRHADTGLMSAASYHSALALEASGFYRTRLPSYRLLLESEEARKAVDFGQVWQNVQWRMTSWPSDEPICLATALSIDLPTILETPEEERFKKILSKLDGFPPYMIFASYERMTETGWRWAPRTLMQAGIMEASKMHHMNATTRWAPEGLIVEFPGFVADMSNLRIKDKVISVTAVDVNKAFELKDEATGAWYHCSRTDLEISDEYTNPYEHRMHGITQLAVILSCPIEALSPSSDDTVQAWDALIVNVTREEGAVLYAEYFARALVGLITPTMWPEADDEVLKMGHIDNPGEDFAGPILSKANCQIMPSTQKWCIG